MTDVIFQSLNDNKFLWGATMLMLNTGSKVIMSELPAAYDVVISHPVFKYLIVFSMFFVATRDVMISAVLTVLYGLLIDGILHEKRRICMLPKSWVKKTMNKDKHDKIINVDEYKRALLTVDSYEKQMKNAASYKGVEKEEYEEIENAATTYALKLKVLNDIE